MIYHNHDEERLEPVARWFRFKEGLREISKEKPITIMDLGCGPKIRFYHFANKNGIKIKKYIGIDPLIKINSKDPQIKLIKSPINKKINLTSNSLDYIVGFAVLEHVDNPDYVLKECLRILKKGGKLILSTPTPRAKGVLEFLSFKLNLISPREIREHKNYFDKKILTSLVKSTYKNKTAIRHKYFELGMNNLLVVTKG